MKPVRVSPLEGVCRFLSSMAEGKLGPEKQIATEIEGAVVDTSLPGDTHIWETCIKREKIEGEWVMVEQYEDEDGAKKGHDKWVAIMTESPDFPIKDINIWSLDER